MRRLLTRSISITPSIIIAGAVGKEGLSAALNGTQVALSVVLPFVSAPLIYFTCRSRYMVVGSRASAASRSDGGGRADRGSGAVEEEDGEGESEEMEQEVETVTMPNHWAVSILAVAIWLVIAVMNVALLVIVGLGKA